MFSRVVFFLFAFLSLFASSQIYAAPASNIGARGNILCEIESLGLSSGLSALNSILSGIASKVTESDPSLASGIQTVTSILSEAESVVSSLLGGSSGSGAVDQIQTYLSAAQSALTGLSSTDTDIASTIEKVVLQLAKTVLSGTGILSSC